MTVICTQCGHYELTDGDPYECPRCGEEVLDVETMEMIAEGRAETRAEARAEDEAEKWADARAQEESERRYFSRIEDQYELRGFNDFDPPEPPEW